MLYGSDILLFEQHLECLRLPETTSGSRSAHYKQALRFHECQMGHGKGVGDVDSACWPGFSRWLWDAL